MVLAGRIDAPPGEPVRLGVDPVDPHLFDGDREANLSAPPAVS